MRERKRETVMNSDPSCLTAAVYWSTEASGKTLMTPPPWIRDGVCCVSVYMPVYVCVVVMVWKCLLIVTVPYQEVGIEQVENKTPHFTVDVVNMS